MSWKFTDSSHQVVARVAEDGREESCSVSAIADWLAAGNTPLPADQPSIDDLKTVQRAALIADCEKAIATIRAGYPENEVLSWSKQEAEARALVADSNAATPLLDALAGERGIAKAELAARVIAKADTFAALSGALIGQRQRLEDQLDALPVDATPEQVAAIVWSSP